MHKPLSRRSALKIIGATAGAGALGSVSTVMAAEPTASANPGATPWKYIPLDPNATAERAFAKYQKGHCAYGTFEAIAGQIAEHMGVYKSFPFEMFIYGAGGVGGWGTLCGTLNGSAAAFQLLSPKPEPLIDALFSWYQSESLPDYRIKDAKFPTVKSISGSPLCHVSVSKWCAASGKRSEDAVCHRT